MAAEAALSRGDGSSVFRGGVRGSGSGRIIFLHLQIDTWNPIDFEYILNSSDVF